MTSAESQLSDIFYKFIDKIPNLSMWQKFVRLLGMSESDIANANSNNRGIQEAKYKLLDCWKMHIGVLPDGVIKEILRETLKELNQQRPYNCNSYPSSLRKNVEKARLIYKFIEKYDNNDWPRIARQRLNLPKGSVNWVCCNNADDPQFEQRYQMVLSWERVNQIQEDTFVERLRSFIDKPLQQPEPANTVGDSLV